MEGDEEGRRAIIHRYYQIYRRLQKGHRLREHSCFDICGNNLIEIWEYAGDGKKRCICNIKGESETECYRRAIEILESYSGKGTVKHGKRAG